MMTGSCGGDGPEAFVFSYTPEVSGDLHVAAEGYFDGVLYVRTACGDPESEIACNADGRDGGAASTIDLLDGATAGTPVFVALDAADVGASGAYGLALWVVP